MALVTCTVAPLLRWFSHVNNRVRFHCVFTRQHVRNHYFSTGDLLEMLPAQAHDCVSTITFLIIICSKCIKKIACKPSHEIHKNAQMIVYSPSLCILHPLSTPFSYVHKCQCVGTSRIVGCKLSWPVWWTAEQKRSFEQKIHRRLTYKNSGQAYI